MANKYFHTCQTEIFVVMAKGKLIIICHGAKELHGAEAGDTTWETHTHNVHDKKHHNVAIDGGNKPLAEAGRARASIVPRKKYGKIRAIEKVKQTQAHGAASLKGVCLNN